MAALFSLCLCVSGRQPAEITLCTPVSEEWQQMTQKMANVNLMRFNQTNSDCPADEANDRQFRKCDS